MTGKPRIRAILSALFVMGLIGSAPASGLAAPTELSASPGLQPPSGAPGGDLELKRQQLKVQAGELDLKVAELAFREREADLSRETERWKSWATFASVLAGIFAIAGPVLIGMRSLSAQRRMALDQARVQFQMKAVDFVLQGALNSKQAKERARALVALFDSDWLPARFAQDFAHADFRIDAGSSLSRRLDLLKLLAENPGARVQILKDWYVVIHSDWWFIDPLLSDLTFDERQALERLAERSRTNDKRSTEKTKEQTGVPANDEAV